MKVAVFNDTRRTSHYGCGFVMQHLIDALVKRNVEPVFYWPMGKDWRGEAGFIESLSGVDGIIVNGEGSIHHSRDSQRAHYLTEIAQFFKNKYSIPSYMVNATLYELEDGIFENLKHFERVFVRESGTKKLLDLHGVRSEVVPDLTFLVKRSRTEAPSSTVLATDSVNSEVTREMRRISSERNWDFTRLIHSSRPHLSDGWTAKEFLRRNAKWLYASALGKNTKNKDQFLDYLMSHRLVCTARFHAVTLSFATMTPFVAVESNTPKISSMVHDVLGETGRVVKLSEIGEIDPAKYTWTEKELKLVSDYLTFAQKSCDAMFDDIVVSLKRSAGDAA